MHQLQLKEIDRVASISKEDFINKYVKSQTPVVIQNLTKDWSAYHKWNFDYIKQIAKNKIVPLYDDRPTTSKYKFNEPHAEMRMEDYINLLQSKPTNYRIFLYSLLKEVPQLQNDFKYPDLGLRFLKGLPFLFFGGENSSVFMHYDIDYANILHFHFEGKKRCVLYPPSESKFLYKVPYALISLEDINFNKPDFKKFPGLKYAKGYETSLNHGDALYMPEGYWHFMTYLTPGFSMSLRSMPKKPIHLMKAIYNIGIMRHYDNFQKKWKGEKWMKYKNKKAIENTEKNILN
ncbi:cupin-like domain-containing protein [Mesonia sp. K7]|uniref:cupin-like domain-containing protein n=1 Tax=Mesonia sp. K7 TaxID=2218606 RepID=UPI000DA70C23|nr:cupin-like domain-containing protein [Mesonia sp. K7]PZD78965.1 cupin-like domain-containing protein [Mesonia sp. K7]